MMAVLISHAGINLHTHINNQGHNQSTIKQSLTKTIRDLQKIEKRREPMHDNWLYIATSCHSNAPFMFPSYILTIL